MRRERPTRRCGVRHSDHEPNLSAEALGQRDALQLRRAQLRLEVAQPTLDLDEDGLTGGAQDHVRGTTVWRGCHGNLKANLPGPMSRGSDRLGHTQLPGIAQGNPVGRVQLHRQPMADASSESRHRWQVGRVEAALEPADRRLTPSSAAGELALRQSSRPACIHQLAAKFRSSVVPGQG